MAHPFEAIATRARELDPDLRHFYAAASAARLVNSLRAMGEKHESSIALIDEAIRLSFDKSPDEGVIRQLIEIVPDEDEGPDELLPLLQDAPIAAIHALRSSSTAEVGEALAAGKQPFETLWSLLIDRLRPDLNRAGIEQELLRHPLMRREAQRQTQDLVDLEAGRSDLVRTRSSQDLLVSEPEILEGSHP